MEGVSMDATLVLEGGILARKEIHVDGPPYLLRFFRGLLWLRSQNRFSDRRELDGLQIDNCVFFDKPSGITDGLYRITLIGDEGSESKKGYTPLDPFIAIREDPLNNHPIFIARQRLRRSPNLSAYVLRVEYLIWWPQSKSHVR